MMSAPPASTGYHPQVQGPSPVTWDSLSKGACFLASITLLCMGLWYSPQTTFTILCFIVVGGSVLGIFGIILYRVFEFGFRLICVPIFNFLWKLTEFPRRLALVALHGLRLCCCFGGILGVFAFMMCTIYFFPDIFYGLMWQPTWERKGVFAIMSVGITSVNSTVTVNTSNWTHTQIASLPCTGARENNNSQHSQQNFSTSSLMNNTEGNCSTFWDFFASYVIPCPNSTDSSNRTNGTSEVNQTSAPKVNMTNATCGPNSNCTSNHTDHTKVCHGIVHTSHATPTRIPNILNYTVTRRGGMKTTGNASVNSSALVVFSHIPSQEVDNSVILQLNLSNFRQSCCNIQWLLYVWLVFILINYLNTSNIRASRQVKNWFLGIMGSTFVILLFISVDHFGKAYKEVNFAPHLESWDTHAVRIFVEACTQSLTKTYTSACTEFDSLTSGNVRTLIGKHCRLWIAFSADFTWKWVGGGWNSAHALYNYVSKLPWFPSQRVHSVVQHCNQVVQRAQSWMSMFLVTVRIPPYCTEFYLDVVHHIDIETMLKVMTTSFVIVVTTLLWYVYNHVF